MRLHRVRTESSGHVKDPSYYLAVHIGTRIVSDWSSLHVKFKF